MQRWTTEDDEALLHLKEEGCTYKAIGEKLNRSAKACNHRYSRIKSRPAHPDSPRDHTTESNVDKACQKLIEENSRLKKQLELMNHAQAYNIDDYGNESVRFGAIADTHLGSFYENIDFLHFIYELFRMEGINVVYHSGDLVDGERMYRGQEYEIHVHGGDAQIDYAIKNYPQIDGIQTKFICGNHDYSFWKSSGFDVGKRIAEHRQDMTYLGPDFADINIRNTAGITQMRLLHPSGGTAYAVSYKSQKYAESLTGGEKPGIILSGHFHKAEHLPGYRNIQYFQVGCIQKQTPFMRGKHTPAMVGAYIIELVLNEQGIIRCKNDFIPWYAK